MKPAEENKETGEIIEQEVTAWDQKGYK